MDVFELFNISFCALYLYIYSTLMLSLFFLFFCPFLHYFYLILLPSFSYSGSYTLCFSPISEYLTISKVHVNSYITYTFFNLALTFKKHFYEHVIISYFFVWIFDYLEYIYWNFVCEKSL